MDNSSYPAITVDIQLILVTPAAANDQCPSDHVTERRAARRERRAPPPVAGPPPAGTDPPATDQLIADGWGYAFLNPGSIQADNGAGLTKGIIGLSTRDNRASRTTGDRCGPGPGVRRAALDYLETDRAADANACRERWRVALRQSRAVTMAFESRFAMVWLDRRVKAGPSSIAANWGESSENSPAGAGVPMEGRQLSEVRAAERTFGSKNAGAFPSTPELIALCAHEDDVRQLRP